MKVSIKYKRLADKLSKLTQEIKELQNSCPHENVEKKHGSNTGNYDPSADCYWVDYKCQDCGKFWTIYK